MLGVVEPVSAVLQALLLGAIVGAVFGFARLQPPAPATWAGVAGIIGIVGGWMIVGHLISRGAGT